SERTRDRVLRSRLAWFTALRLLLLAVLLTLIGLFYLRGRFAADTYSVNVVLATLGIGFALAALYATVLRSGRRLRELGYVGLVLDQVTFTALVYVSGGPGSGATALYGLTCLGGAILLGPRGATVAAAAGAACYFLLCAGFVSGALSVPPN